VAPVKWGAAALRFRVEEMAEGVEFACWEKKSERGGAGGLNRGHRWSGGAW
jgi:hypothetical protein